VEIKVEEEESKSEI